jgi:hypothetical protein
VFTVQERETLRSQLLVFARADARITGAAITGSASVDRQDRWSDIDLAFGVREVAAIENTLAAFSARMYSICVSSMRLGLNLDSC